MSKLVLVTLIVAAQLFVGLPRAVEARETDLDSGPTLIEDEPESMADEAAQNDRSRRLADLEDEVAARIGEPGQVTLPDGRTVTFPSTPADAVSTTSVSPKYESNLTGQTESRVFRVDLELEDSESFGAGTPEASKASVTYRRRDAAASVQVSVLSSGAIRYLYEVEDSGAPHQLSVAIKLPSTAEIVPLEGGSAVVIEVGQSDLDAPIGFVSRPFAFDANGKSLDVTQEIDTSKSTVTVSVEPVAGMAYPIVMDPTYSFISCQFGSHTSWGTLNLLTVPGVCPGGLSFVWANGYWPKSATIPGGSYRNVFADIDGGDFCSNTIDQGIGFDFRVPCAMHDYCYDLVRTKSPFNYTNVSKNSCDSALRTALSEHCNSRPWYQKPACFTAKIVTESGVIIGTWAFGGPAPESRPGGSWPSMQFVSNQLQSGTNPWDWQRNTPTMNWAMYANIGVYGTSRLEWNCAGLTGSCSVYNDRIVNTYSGERFTTAGWFFCNHPSNCDATLAVWGFKSTGGADLVLAKSFTVSPGTWKFKSYAHTLKENGGSRITYNKLRYEVYVNSPTDNIAVSLPSMIYIDD